MLSSEELLVAPLASLLLLTLLWPMLWLPRVSFILPLALRSILLAFRLWRRRLMVDYHRLRLLTLDCRASLVRRSRGRPLNALAFPLRRV